MTRHPRRLGPGSESPRCGPAVPGSRLSAQGPAGSTGCPGILRPGSKGPQGRGAVPGLSRLGPNALGVDQLSRATPARLRTPVGSTSCSRPPALVSEGPRCRPAVSGSRARFRWPMGSTSCPWRLGPESKGPQCRPSVPGDSHSSPKARGVDQLSRATRALVQGPGASTRPPRRIALWSDSLWVRPAVPGDSGPVPRT